MPITRLELLLGKYFGLAGALSFSTVAGFGLVAILLSPQLDFNALIHYFGFMLSSVLLGCAFLSMAVMLSVFASDRTSRIRARNRPVVFLRAGVRPAAARRTGRHRWPVGRRSFPLPAPRKPRRRVPRPQHIQPGRRSFHVWTDDCFPPALANSWLLGLVMVAWIAAPLGIATWRFRK